MSRLSVLAVYRGKLMEDRGTPIRVRSLLRQLEQDERIQLHIASWDEHLTEFPHHFTLSNNHLDDYRKLSAYVRSHHIPVVMGHTVAPSYYLAALKLFTGVKIVLEMHGIVEEEAREYDDISFLNYWLLKSWYTVFYAMCDLITTCSKSITDIVGRHNRHAYSLCGGVDPKYFNPQAPSGEFIKKDGRIIIGYAGNARIWQGLDFLMKAYDHLYMKHSEFRLALLLSESKGVDINGRELYGPLKNSEVPGFLIDCDILVIPRPLTTVTRISFPSKVPEYMAMGKAIVASNLGDIDQVIQHGVNGLLYTPGNEDELLECLLTLRDPAVRGRLGRAATESAQALTWEKLGNQLVDSLLKLT